MRNGLPRQPFTAPHSCGGWPRDHRRHIAAPRVGRGARQKVPRSPLARREQERDLAEPPAATLRNRRDGHREAPKTRRRQSSRIRRGSGRVAVCARAPAPLPGLVDRLPISSPARASAHARQTSSGRPWVAAPPGAERRVDAIIRLPGEIGAGGDSRRRPGVRTGPRRSRPMQEMPFG
jgi:hypothetical protein